MARNEIQRSQKERLSRLHPMPWGSARGVRQRDAVGLAARELHPKTPADDVLEWTGLQKAADRQLAHRDHQGRLKEPELGLEPVAAGLDLVGRRHAVASLGILPGKAAADGGKVDAVAVLGLGPSERTPEPL
jgi:hypothetical protein